MAAPETAASSGASTAAAEAVPTAFALLPTDQRARLASSEEVAAAVSTISSQVSAQQRNDFGALTDKEFRDHFAGLLNVRRGAAGTRKPSATTPHMLPHPSLSHVFSVDGGEVRLRAILYSTASEHIVGGDIPTSFSRPTTMVSRVGNGATERAAGQLTKSPPHGPSPCLISLSAS